jgi:signal transduction histidine kinase
VDRAIADLDQTFALMTALLRIGQIEASARRAGFADVSLTAIAREVFELYQPVAELNDIALSLSVTADLHVHGDRDLLFEVAANLVDNAVKFTPPGGLVQVAARQTLRGPVLCVQDSGPGIPEEERSAAMQRFHRADRSRHVPGYGLGLSLVSAILRLHLFHLHMGDGAPGLVAEVRTWPVAA